MLCTDPAGDGRWWASARPVNVGESQLSTPRRVEGWQGAGSVILQEGSFTENFGKEEVTSGGKPRCGETWVYTWGFDSACIVGVQDGGSQKHES